MTAPTETAAGSGNDLWMYSNFDDLLLDRPIRQATVDDIGQIATSRGRVHVQAKYGSGKTTLLWQLARNAADRIEAEYVHVPSILAREAPQSARDVPILLEEAIGGRLDALTDNEAGCLILADGLDELPASAGAAALEFFDGFAGRSPGNGVVVADGMRRRDLRYDRWSLLTLRNSPLTWWTRKETLLSAVCRQRFASLGFDESQSAKTLPLEFADRSSEPAELTTSFSLATGRSEVEATDLGMSHILMRDYVRAQQIVDGSHQWSKESFDRLSMGGTHFEQFALAAELVDANVADELARTIYGWNFYAATYMLRVTPGYEPGSRVGGALSAALLALAAERRWDVLHVTAQAASDELLSLANPIAGHLMQLADHDALLAYVAGLQFEDAWFARWQTLFTRPSGAAAKATDLDLLVREDALLAWTTANVLKRSSLEPELHEALVGVLLGAPDDNSRWRAAHVLGSDGNEDTVDALFNAAADDPFRWVRRTACRSLIEIAARTPADDMREVVGEKLTALAGNSVHREVLEEMRRSLIVQAGRYTGNWPIVVGPAVDALLTRTRSKTEVESLLDLGHRLQASTGREESL